MSATDGRAGRTAREALPLNSIRVFAEAAREGSFSRAARALGMTQGGVSHHVAALERALGHSLFTRTGSAVQLSDAGRTYFEAVSEALSTIELATRQMTRRTVQARRLVVRTSLPTFAMTVLIPMLPAFQAHPPVGVDLLTSLSAPDAGDDYDVLVSRDLALAGAEHWRLASEELVCVGSPALQRQWAGQPVAAWPFVSAGSRPDALVQWAAQHACAMPRVVASFAHYFLALPATLAGLGLLVVPRLLVQEPLRHGHLAEMPTAPVRSSASYNAYVNPLTPSPEPARAFCRWLKRQLGRDGPTAAEAG